MKIINIEALQILDSRANPTLQVEVFLEDGSKGVFLVPSGASTGIHEAHELRDEDMSMYHGKSVLKAIGNVDLIKTKLYDIDFNQESLDRMLIELDGTENKEVLGANAIVGVSVAFAKACAKYYNLPLHEYLYRLVNGVSLTNKSISELGDTHLLANVINGGLHSGNSLNVQEFMVVPIFGKLQEKVRAISEIYNTLKEIIKEQYGKSQTAVGDEGGFAPEISRASEALDLIVEAIGKSGYDEKVVIGIDAAASDFYDSQTKLYEVERGLKLNYKELTEYYNTLLEKYPLFIVEDPMAEDDFEGFAYFYKNVKQLDIVNPLINRKEVLVIGDDILVTNTKRIKIAQEKKICNSLLLKVNQIGTLTESFEAFKLASSTNWHTVVSHRSGETTDSFISDLAVALRSSIKLGSPARGERVAKYNRLLNIFK